MKTYMLLISQVLCLSAGAFPSVGDQVIFSGSVLQADGTLTPTKTVLRVVEKNADGSFRKTNDVDCNGKILHSESNVFDNTRAEIVEMIENCSALLADPAYSSAVQEDLETPLGVLKTCHLKFVDSPNGDKSEFWIADVPNSVAKSVNYYASLGNTVTDIIESFVDGEAK